MKTQQMPSPVWHPFTQAKTAPPPLKVRRGNGIYLELEDGRNIVDCISSWWVNVHGHSQPEIAKAIYEQSQILEHVIFAGFTHDPAERLANEVLKYLPANLAKVFFSDNGTTAVEVAMKMAYQFWQNKDNKERVKFVNFDQGYHGETVGSMSLGKSTAFFKPFEKLLFETDSIPFPATWEGDKDVHLKEEESLSKLKSLFATQGQRYVAVIIEPLIQGAGGMRMCRIEFMQELEKLVHEYGILLIYDEVMTGFGRTGDWFACAKSKTRPDIICLSKGLTGGFLPLALTIATEEIYQSFYSDDIQKAFFHSHSYTGNPLACAAAYASIKLLNDMQNNFKDMAKLHQMFFQKWLGNCQFLEKLRYCGTILAFDVITDERTHYFNALGLTMRQAFLDEGLLIRPLGNTIYLMPPYCIRADELELIYKKTATVISKLLAA